MSRRGGPSVRGILGDAIGAAPHEGISITELADLVRRVPVLARTTDAEIEAEMGHVLIRSWTRRLPDGRVTGQERKWIVWVRCARPGGGCWRWAQGPTYQTPEAADREAAAIVSRGDGQAETWVGRSSWGRETGPLSREHPAELPPTWDDSAPLQPASVGAPSGSGFSLGHHDDD